MVIVALGVCFLLVLFTIIMLRRGSTDEKTQAAIDAYKKALADEKSSIGKLLLQTGKPLLGSSYTNLSEESPAYQQIRLRLTAAGGLYAGSPVVYLSVQIMTVTLALGILGFAVLSGTDGFGLLVVAFLAFALAYYPWQRIGDGAKKRGELINQDLPNFAELLLMPLSSGYSVLPALEFTSKRMDGPVSDEVKLLLGSIASRTMSDTAAFALAGEHLGTTPAMAFFTTLAQAQKEGSAVVENLKSQAEHLRKMAYERTREKIKILPNKMVVIMAIHLMPALFAVILVPIVLSWAIPTS